MNQARHFTRTALAVIAASSLWLAGCGSTVKLDDQAGQGPAPITTANGAGANASGAGNSAVPSTAIAPVVVDNANKAADDSGLARVVYFDYDSFVVKEEFRGAVEGHAKRLNASKARKVIVEGHTDERGGSEYNLALGQKRAEAVQKSLTLLGVSAEQVEAVSFGKERPAVQGSNEEAWAKNRRAEIKDR
ncbi:peptidoglycan-associated lipoprotein Pal [Aquabacterium sp.]|uniref:peptidoglycan-associated lipoprotein Pal n=1 Tax=Aquabacterium sp. TaxID=1872578 RepID=UPI0025C17C8C|nr:peptidoglycan-associated lipoprotein Pal [Aquabacterium sp.]